MKLMVDNNIFKLALDAVGKVIGLEVASKLSEQSTVYTNNRIIQIFGERGISIKPDDLPFARVQIALESAIDLSRNNIGSRGFLNSKFPVVKRLASDFHKIFFSGPSRFVNIKQQDLLQEFLNSISRISAPIYTIQYEHIRNLQPDLSASAIQKIAGEQTAEILGVRSYWPWIKSQRPNLLENVLDKPQTFHEIGFVIGLEDGESAKIITVCHRDDLPYILDSAERLSQSKEVEWIHDMVLLYGVVCRYQNPETLIVSNKLISQGGLNRSGHYSVHGFDSNVVDNAASILGELLPEIKVMTWPEFRAKNTASGLAKIPKGPVRS